MAFSPDSRFKNKTLIKDRLQLCWNMDLDWSLFPEALKEVIVDMYTIKYVYDGVKIFY